MDVNAETLRMFGARDKAELLHSLEAVFATPDTLPGFIGELIALANRQPEYRSEMALRTVAGDLITVMLTMTFPPGDSGSGTVLVSLMDITARRQAEEELRYLNAVLEERVAERTARVELANRELEAFSYSVSHDLRAPLRAIDGFAQVLVEDYAAALDNQALQIVGVIRSEAQRMGCLIDELLSFSRLGRQPIARETVDMGALVRSAFDEVAASAPEREVAFAMDPLPAAWGEPTLPRQVWVNLLANAVKFTRRRAQATIHVGGEAADSENTYSVQDNGAGFDMRFASKLFGVFQRLHTQSEFEGTGVGLAIVQRVVLRHGGRVWAKGAPDRGATFSFALPRGKDD